MISRARIKVLRELHHRDGRVAAGLMLVEGPRLVDEALAAGVLTEIFMDDAWSGAASLRDRAGDVPVMSVLASDLERLVDVRTPAGVAGLVPLNRPLALPALLAAHQVVLFLEGVQDPGNVGTLARTARAFGVNALVLGPGTADVTAPKTLRSSAGALLTMTYARDVDTAGLLAAAAESGHAVVVADAHAGTDYRQLVWPARRVLAVANEGAGTAIPRGAGGVLRVTIPLAPGAESLNVAAAAAILLAAARATS